MKDIFYYTLLDNQIDQLVDPLELMHTIKQVLIQDTEAPLRSSIERHGSWYAAMVAGGLGYFSTKLVGVYPENPKRGLPLVRAVLALFDAITGDPLLLAEAGAATGWRTAAGTLVALEALSVSEINTLGLIGAGFQARYHARAIMKLYHPKRILVYDMDREKVSSFLEEFPMASESSLDRVLKDSDLLVTATTSIEPVVKGDLLRKNTVVASIGAPRPVRELDEAVKRRASCLLVDTLVGALAETDDAKGFKKVVDLRMVLRNEDRCTPGDVKVYKSVGTALFDHAIAIYLYEKLEKSMYF
ncbi:MAG: ornithine cyclodeaminase family protein [Desulfurococcales archaeon]|nr:ornithine cyclodeaminase family protein [Desulfurococcales archaeon]